MTITRTAWTDDDGTGTTGTIINNAAKTSLYDQIDTLIGAQTSYTPTWGNTGTANVLNNGTLVGTYQKFDTHAFFSIILTFGSSTTVGNGTMTFSLPFNSGGHPGVAAITGFAVKSSNGAIYPFIGYIVSANTFYCAATDLNPANVYTATVPITWATGDHIYICGHFFTA